MNRDGASNGSVSTGSLGSMNQSPSSGQPIQPVEEEEDIIIFDNASDTDMSMSASDNDSQDLGYQDTSSTMPSASVTHLSSGDKLPLITNDETERKRKSPLEMPGDTPSAQPTKKVKMGEDKSARHSGTRSPKLEDNSYLLPKAIWHHIFTFVPPQGLGNLLQVNRMFNRYLDPSVPLSSFDSTPLGCLHSLLPDEIWRAARKLFLPKMPAPLKGKTEVEMWRLVHKRRCQFCGKMAQDSAPVAMAKSKPGPGTDGVKLIWQFAVRSCGLCLIAKSMKEIDLLLSPSVPSLLLPALPFVLTTSDMQFFSPSALAKGHIVGDPPLTKIFLSKQVETLKDEFLSVKTLGTGAVEEWLKGLEERGKEQRLDADRWAKWESSGGLHQMWMLRHSVSSSILNSPTIEPRGRIESSLPTEKLSPALGESGKPLPMTSTDLGRNLQHILPPKITEEPPSQLQSSAQSSQQAPVQGKRTLQEVMDLKATRRAEIERRSMLLDPPLPPNVLAHIPSFQAALQIITPLDESAWEMLKPRLLLQRVDAEQREQRNQLAGVPSAIVQKPAEDQKVLESQTSETKELTDKDWDDAQAPLRAQISIYADELIRDSWDDGSKVDKETSPRFAVEVLLHVRKRFYADIAKAAAAARASGKEPVRDPPQGPFTQKLTLENMKWLFEVKVKPHTETYRKELFLCNGCEDSLKAYGFEGVVQHYAAKHTHDMSVGSIVVYWRSEWPEVPPFHPDPVARNAQPRNVTVPPAQQVLGQYGIGHHQPPAFGSSAPGQIGSTYPGQYGQSGSQFQHGAYGLSAAFPPHQAPYNPVYPQQSVTFHPGYSMPASTAPPPAGLHLQPHHPQHISNSFPGVHATMHYNTNYENHQISGHAGFPLPPAGLQSDRMRAQLEELVHNSREIWMSTAGVKELPGYIRVYVCLHHLAKRYRSRFSESPPLTMFIDGLSNHKEMRPVRNVNGLMCKACHLGLGNFVAVENERSAFSLPQLVNHFQQKHIEPLQNMGAPLLDWTVDMVFLPEVASLSSLKGMMGMDSHKYGLITDAFPQMSFPGYFNAHTPSEQATTYEGHMTSLLPTPHNGFDSTHGAGLPATVIPGGQLRKNDISGQNQLSDYSETKPPQPGADGSQYHIPELAGYALQAGVPLTIEGHTLTQRPSQKISHNNSGKNSPDWPAGKHRNRKTSGKERRTNPGQGGKSRKGNAKNGPDHGKAAAEPVETEQEKEAEAEAQRQEEAIRAMWAADRKAAARMASSSTAPQRQHSTGPRPKSPSVELKLSAPKPASPTIPAIQSNAEPRNRQDSPILISDHEEDLFASLESHLDQQHAPRSATVVMPNRHANRHAGYDQAHAQPDLDTRRAPPAVDEWPLREHGRPRSPGMEIRNARPQQGSYYGERSPDSLNPGLTYTRVSPQIEIPEPLSRGRQPARSYVNDYDPAPLQDRGIVYVDEPRQRPAASIPYAESYSTGQGNRPAPSHISYTEVWERVLVRDSRGDEYYIERPIRRDPEPIYIRYEDEQPRYRETTSFRSYEQDGHRREPTYETIHRHEAPTARQRGHEAMPFRPDSAQRQIIYEDAPRGSAAPQEEEYDPRFPAAPSSLGPPRHARYH